MIDRFVVPAGTTKASVTVPALAMLEMTVGVPETRAGAQVIACVPVTLTFGVAPFGTVAVIVALPLVTQVTRPVALTVAIALLLLDHVAVVPATVVPEAAFDVCVSCIVLPTPTIAA